MAKEKKNKVMKGDIKSSNINNNKKNLVAKVLHPLTSDWINLIEFKISNKYYEIFINNKRK